MKPLQPEGLPSYFSGRTNGKVEGGVGGAAACAEETAGGAVEGAGALGGTKARQRDW